MTLFLWRFSDLKIQWEYNLYKSGHWSTQWYLNVLNIILIDQQNSSWSRSNFLTFFFPQISRSHFALRSSDFICLFLVSGTTNFILLHLQPETSYRLISKLSEVYSSLLFCIIVKKQLKLLLDGTWVSNLLLCLYIYINTHTYM